MGQHPARRSQGTQVGASQPEISVSVAEGTAVVTVRGALVRTVHNEQLTDVVASLCEFGERRVRLYAAGISAVDMNGLVTLVNCDALLNRVGGRLVVTMPSEILRLALRRTGLDQVLVIVGGAERDADKMPFPAK